ncbi:MAG TPA: hypothetical protein VGS57_05330 [Thermoanaerobaculia bacterium]|nr:hypothetical protein [Thermoanaerobaculia bacterium]
MRVSRSLASGLILALAVAPLILACATTGQPASSATTAASAAPAEPVAGTAEPAVAAEPVARPSAAATNGTAGAPCEILNCGSGCDNFPVTFSPCYTTPYGPAEADVILSPTNFLYCEHSRYALCFFSGPPQATGRNPHNKELPCVLSADGTTANCTCQVYTSGPSYVDINGILNNGAWKETVQTCGTTGAACKNLLTCGKDPTSDACQKGQVPPVCQYVLAQNSEHPEVGLMGKADMVSTFSFAMSADYPMQPQTDCTANGGGAYAGCMTAACFFAPDAPRPPQDGDTIQCQCPVYHGPFQVGQSGQSCTIPSSDGKSYVWSAAYNPKAGSGTL